MKLLNKFSDEVKNHHLFKENEKEILERGIDSFLRGNGVFVEVIPLVTPPPPPHKIINLHFEIEYWIKKKDEFQWNLGHYKSDTMVNEEEILEKAILKGFEYLESRIKGEFEKSDQEVAEGVLIRYFQRGKEARNIEVLERSEDDKYWIFKISFHTDEGYREGTWGVDKEKGWISNQLI